jgi:hypothetical protein
MERQRDGLGEAVIQFNIVFDDAASRTLGSSWSAI